MILNFYFKEKWWAESAPVVVFVTMLLTLCLSRSPL